MVDFNKMARASPEDEQQILKEVLLAALSEAFNGNTDKLRWDNILDVMGTFMAAVLIMACDEAKRPDGEGITTFTYDVSLKMAIKRASDFLGDENDQSS